MECNLLITANEEKCEGCNKCINVCPIPGANIAYSECGKNKIRIDQNKCIHCGHCIEFCDHKAREFCDDIERFIKDISDGKKISILVAPSFRINFKEYKKVFGFLKSLGINLIYDVAFGAEIYTWGCTKVINKKNSKPMISQACPVIVNYIEKYQPNLIQSLLPIQSPMMCSAIYLKVYEKYSDELAFLSPCISKKDEINDINTNAIVRYNITFIELEKYIKENNIDLDKYEERDYDVVGHGLGGIFSKPGGFRENIESYLKGLWIEEVYGQKYAYQYLKEYEERMKDELPNPNILDILNCKMGCNMGPATEKRISNYDIGHTINEYKKEKLKEGIEDRNKIFDKILNLEDFVREYKDLSNEAGILAEPTESEYKTIFKKLHKDTIDKQNINCFSCGYSSCKTMAKAIYNNINYESNCIYYNKNELQIEVDKKKQALEELKFIAFNDFLTNTYNRRGIKNKLESMINKANGNKSKVGILFIDLDKFKMINDIFGHDKGDYIIRKVADRLKEAVGVDGVIGRLGGDEFLIVIGEIYEVNEIKKVARRIIHTFRKPFILRNKKNYVTCSLGVCVFPDHGEDADSLLKNADASMYRVKEKSGNGFEMYNEEAVNKLHKQYELLGEMGRGIRKKEFILYYQPKIEVDTGKIAGLEALVRWKHKSRGIIYPNEFINLAEDMGFIEKVDLYVLKSACIKIKEWISRDVEFKNVSVNISARLFNDLKFIEKVDSIISRSGIDHSFISIEVTETAAISNVQYTNEILKILREKGINILLDDFGKGYSSLSYLKEFPVDILKVDKSFIEAICTNKVNKIIMEALINLAKALKIKVVAEGVETKEQLEVLKDLGCDYYQGYLFSKPVPSEEVEKLLLNRNF